MKSSAFPFPFPFETAAHPHTRSSIINSTLMTDNCLALWVSVVKVKLHLTAAIRAPLGFVVLAVCLRVA